MACRRSPYGRLTESTTQIVKIAGDKVSVARALEKGHDTIVENQTSRGQSR